MEGLHARDFAAEVADADGFVDAAGGFVFEAQLEEFGGGLAGALGQFVGGELP